LTYTAQGSILPNKISLFQKINLNIAKVTPTTKGHCSKTLEGFSLENINVFAFKLKVIK